MSKVVALSEAIAKFVNDGDIVYAAGFTHLIPFAAGHEIIRQGRKDLTLARATPDLIYDMMVAAGCARKVIFSYMGNPGVGSLRIVRSALEQGKLEWEEYSHFGMITRLQAGASGLPFLPMNQTGGTDLENANPNIKRIPDPYGGKDVIVIVVAHIERQVPVDAFERAWAIQATRAASPDAMFDCGFGQVFDRVPGATAGDLRFVVMPRFP